MEDRTSDFRILVIDDNPSIHHDFIKILTTSSSSKFDVLSEQIFGKKKDDEYLLPKFQIDTASQGQEGVACIQKAIQDGHPYSLAFVDIRMPPGWDGIETIKQIWRVDKDVQIVICTAYSDYSWEETVTHLGKTDNLLILKKPFDNVSVRQLACALTKKWQLLQDTRQYTASLKQQIYNRTQSLNKSLSLVKATLESSDEGIMVINDEGSIIEYNKQFLTMWDVPDEIIESKEGSKVLSFMIDQLSNPQEFSDFIREIHEKNETIRIDSIKFKNGKILDCYSQPQKIDKKIVGRVLNFRDITKRTHLEDELQYQATHDALTGLPNRIVLFKKLQEAIIESDSNNTIFAVLFLDLDRFKLINDSLSHTLGDEVLKATAGRLQAILREEDTLARLGGDEFVIVLKNLKSEEQALIKANKLLALFQQPFQISNRSVTVTASIGINFYPKDAKTVDTLLRNADAAMYHAKELGSNNFQMFTTEMHSQSLEKLEKEMQLHQALNKGEFALCYQPQYDLSNDNLVAVEALLRWNHPQKGTLLPLDFIPVAEETGLIVPIGEWVLRTACKQNKAWQNAGLPPIRVAVNITMQQLKQQNIVEVVEKILTETELKPEYLEIELTENVAISSMEIIRVVTALKKLGVTIAIDDFGTGYSSLSYLKKLPFDRLKIDSSFIRNINSETEDEVIIRAIISVAKNLNLEVLAEGVETQNQLNFLKKQNCDEIQGFYFSKPLSPEEFTNLLKNPDSPNKLLEKQNKE